MTRIKPTNDMLRTLYLHHLKSGLKFQYTTVDNHRKVTMTAESKKGLIFKFFTEAMSSELGENHIDDTGITGYIITEVSNPSIPDSPTWVFGGHKQWEKFDKQLYDEVISFICQLVTEQWEKFLKGEELR